MNRESGLTLVEVLVATLLMAFALTALLSGFSTFTTINTHNEMRSEAIQAARSVMDAWRGMRATELPDADEVKIEKVSVGSRVYQVRTRFCSVPAFCSDESRHVVVEVLLEGRRIYGVESVYSTLF